MTSQKCSKCGHVSKDNRLKQEQFICTSCNYSANADYNASINILKKSILITPPSKYLKNQAA